MSCAWFGSTNGRTHSDRDCHTIKPLRRVLSRTTMPAQRDRREGDVMTRLSLLASITLALLAALFCTSPARATTPDGYFDLTFGTVAFPGDTDYTDSGTGVGYICLLYTSDAADERSSVDLGG